MKLRPTAAPVAVFQIDGELAFRAWLTVKGVATAEHLWPVIVGDPAAWNDVAENATYSTREPDDVLREAGSIRYVDWLKTRSDYVRSGGALFPEDGKTYPPHPADKPDFAATRSLLSGGYLPTVDIAVVDAADGPDAVADLLFGCWNDNPCPAEHVAVLPHWNEKFGAELVSVTGETLELLVRRPPSDWDTSLALAREMYAYDYDIVEQGTETINVLAGALEDSPTWYFWWD